MSKAWQNVDNEIKFLILIKTTVGEAMELFCCQSRDNPILSGKTMGRISRFSAL